MTGPEQDALLIAVDASSLNLALSGMAEVRHLLPPRMALLRSPIARLPDGVRIFTTAPPEDVMRELTANEQLFVAAWLVRRNPKERPGDGAAWDAAGFTPPG